MREELDVLRQRVEQLEQEVDALKKAQSTHQAVESKVNDEDVHLEKDLQPAKTVLPIKEKRKTPGAEQQVIAGEVESPEFEEQKPVTLSTTQKTQPSTKDPLDFEQLLGKWLPRVFMFILLLGVLWGLKVASDYGLLSDGLRIVGGYGATVLLYFLGMKYIRQEQTVFGGTLLSGIIAIGMLTTFAAHYLYGFFPAIIALVIGIGYVALGVWLSSKTKIEVLTLFSAIAGFLLPYLLEGTETQSILLYGYILTLFLSLFYVSIKEQHKYTFYITFLLFHLTLYFLWLLSYPDHVTWLALSTVLIQHAAIIAFYMLRKIPRHIFTETLVYTNFILTIGWFQLLIYTEKLWLYGLFAIVYMALTTLAYKQKDRQLTGILSAITVLAVAMFILTVRPDDDRITILTLLITGTASIWVGLKFNSVRTLLSGAIVYIGPALTILSLYMIESVFSMEHLGWLILLYSVTLFYYTLYDSPPKWARGKLDMIDRSLVIGQILLLIYVTRIIQLIVEESVLLTYSDMMVRHIFFLGWMAVLGAMYQFRKWKHGQYIVHAACILYLLLGIPMLFSSIYSSLYDVIKYATFYAFAIQLLYVAGLVMMIRLILTKQFYWTSEKLFKQLPLWGFLLQMILFLFVNKWYISIALHLDIQREFFLLLHTAILLIFTFISISIGRKFKWKAVQFGGVFLLFVSIFKLFFIDLFAISILIRALLFIGVGIGGLLYSKTLLQTQKPSTKNNQHEKDE